MEAWWIGGVLFLNLGKPKILSVYCFTKKSISLWDRFMKRRSLCYVFSLTSSIGMESFIERSTTIRILILCGLQPFLFSHFPEGYVAGSIVCRDPMNRTRWADEYCRIPMRHPSTLFGTSMTTWSVTSLHSCAWIWEKRKKYGSCWIFLVLLFLFDL